MTTGAHRADPAARTLGPLGLGLAAMLSALIGPGWIPGTVGLGGAFLAGAINRDEPVRAGLLVIALPVAGAAVRVLVDRPSAVGALLFGMVSLAGLALIASHLGAGMRRRRTVAGGGP